MFDTLLAKGFTIFAQAMVKIQPIWDKYKALISLVVGILIGWFVIGWGLAPVEWTNATPGHLREDYKSAYLAYASQEYYNTGDLALLENRLGLDLPKARTVPWLADDELLQQDMETAINKAPQYRLENYLSALNGVQQIAATEQGIAAPEEALPAEGEESEVGATPLARLLRIVAIAAVALLVIGAAGIIWYLLTSRKAGAAPKREARAKQPRVAVPEPGVGVVEGQEPVKSFSTPYVLGDDYFDPSFSIEIGNDFLGECGIGISETIGAGDPKKVTAFEAWLFDKSDIRTVTKVLASQYAFSDPDLRSKLEPKGDIVMLSPGQEITLETSALRVKARVKELEYAQGASLPPMSFVQKVNFEIQAWVKQADELEEDYA
ncbi:MAG: hypothetical protein JXC32_05885 [Anaerolineae bacterium]|nr:hypothetical protein [Anaerolineae bacterium]